MEYVVYKRFKGTSVLQKNVNIPYGKVCESKMGIIIYQGEPICLTTSENAHQFFARDDDGCGLERGKLITEIFDLLRFPTNKAKKSDYDVKWERIWNDELCKKYKHPAHEDYWLWNHDFYNAPIDDLNYIKHLINKGGK